MEIKHTFHVPVMGLGFTIDTPLKIAKYGIDSVISVMDDHLIEEMRRIYSEKFKRKYIAITQSEKNYRSKRITKYLNLILEIVEEQISEMRNEAIQEGTNLFQYYTLLPNSHKLKELFNYYLSNFKNRDCSNEEIILRNGIEMGSIDVNIMTKIDSLIQFSKEENETIAKTALKGFAESDLNTAVIFSAGMNPKLFTYCEDFIDFYPDSEGQIKKKIILKVSDYRSAVVQGKFFAKKGLWISEFRIESMINCGGHAFVSNGALIGPILKEFKTNRQSLFNELFEICQESLENKNRATFKNKPKQLFTYQGGLGSFEENQLIFDEYGFDKVGWGSPFLMVPECTNVDEQTMKSLILSKKDDFYLSKSSPLGVPYNNFKNHSSNTQRIDRINKKRPGSPCYKKFLISNTEFSKSPICTASRQYQKMKINEIENSMAKGFIREQAIDEVVQKECLCEGLGASAIMVLGGNPSHNLTAVSICPGPNLYHFKTIYSLKEMIEHIYGKSLIKFSKRSHFLINEIKLYLDFMKVKINESTSIDFNNLYKNLKTMKVNIIEGIEYYRNKILNKHFLDDEFFKEIEKVYEELMFIDLRLNNLCTIENGRI